MRRKLGAVEEAWGPLVQTVTEGLVAPLEIEHVKERLADAGLDEQRAPRIEHECGHWRRHSGFELLADHLPIGYRGEVVSARPTRRIALAPEVVQSLLEGFERCIGVTIIVVSHDIEIEPAAVYGEIAPPVIGVAAIADGPARFDAIDDIGS